MALITFVSFRLGLSDGVSIEAAKWMQACRALGHDVRSVAGEGPVDVVLRGLRMNAPVPPSFDDLARALVDADVVVVENLASLPLNVKARDVLYDVLHTRRALFHHHDLPWQRTHLAHLEGPRDEPEWCHVTINALSQRQLRERGIESVLLPNSFDCDPPMGSRDTTRAQLGLREERLVLMPTRALARKNVAGALELCERLDAQLWLLGPAEDGYGENLDSLLDASKVTVRRGLDVGDVHDAYAACDLVVMPSTWEGFGNPVLEAVTHRRALALNVYPVAREFIARGFEFFELDEVSKIREFIEAPDAALLDRNLEVARKYFNLDDLAPALSEVLSHMNVQSAPLVS
jgi:glycosyltransferase involved in cell wall biosynthesis